MYEICAYIFIDETENSIAIDPIFPYMKLKSPYFIYEICTYIIIHEIQKIVLIYEIRTWLGLLFHPWGLGSLGFHGWTVVGLK